MTPLDVLRERGWCQRTVEDAAKRVCMVGAAKVAYLGDARGRPAFELPSDWCDAVSAVIAEQFPERCFFDHGSPPIFNDHDDTTFADVELVLEKAEIRLAEQVTP